MSPIRMKGDTTMKIKEFIKTLTYSLTYNEDITITIGCNDVRFIYDDVKDSWEVIIKDFDNHMHRIAILNPEDSIEPDRYSTWCDQDYQHHEPYDRTIHTIV